MEKQVLLCISQEDTEVEGHEARRRSQMRFYLNHTRWLYKGKGPEMLEGRQREDSGDGDNDDGVCLFTNCRIQHSSHKYGSFEFKCKFIKIKQILKMQSLHPLDAL